MAGVAAGWAGSGWRVSPTRCTGFLSKHTTGRADGRGRPRRHPREAMNGILGVMRTGAPWADMPSRYPPGSTCHRYCQAWVKAGVFIQILNVLAEDLYARGRIDLSECFIDGTFVPAKRGATASARPSAAKRAYRFCAVTPIDQFNINWLKPDAAPQDSKHSINGRKGRQRQTIGRSRRSGRCRRSPRAAASRRVECRPEWLREHAVSTAQRGRHVARPGLSNPPTIFATVTPSQAR